MKLKQLFAAALLLCSVGAWAQTDVTSTYITNADFSSTAGWTAYVSSSFKNYGNGLIGTYGVRTDEGQAVSTVDATHLATEYCFGFEVRWSSSYAAYQQTTAELPVGHYELSFDVENTNSKTTSASYNNLFYVQVGENKTTDTKTEWMSAGKSSWTTHTISFDLTAASTATISLGYGTGSNNIGSANTPTLHVSHLKLTWTDPLAAAKSALQAEIDKAKLCDAKEGLADAIAAAEGVYASATTTAELEEALATLQAADKDAVLRYENGLADATYAAPVVTNFVVNGTFDSGISPWQRTGSYQNNKTANNKQGAFTGNFYENWNGSAQVNKMYQVINNIPNGTYRLDIAAFVNNLADPNESQYVFANSDKTYLTTVDPTAYEVWTVVTNNQVEVGLEQTTATANWMGIDNVSLRYYGAGDVINDAKNAAHKLAWEEAKAAAEAAIANDGYANVTGSEKTALETEIAKAEPTTADDYDTAAAALVTATQTFVDAKAAYDAYANFLADYLPSAELVYAQTEKYTAIGDAYWGNGDVVDAADATARVAAALTAVRAYYESHALAEKVGDAVNMTGRITNANNPTNNDGWTWTGNKNNPASNEPWTDADGTNTHSYFDGGNWSSSSWTTTMSQTISIPAGKYLLTAKGRAAENTTLTMAVGENVANLPHVGSAGNVFDRGWGDASVEFVSDGSDVTILVTATSSTIHEWFSISDFRLVRLELYTQMADADDYAALNAAIQSAEAKELGFDAGEYAPYNNVETIKALATAKAIDQSAENAKDDVTALTETLTNGWTANTTEVNAFYDGNFNIQPEHTTGPTALSGWNNPEGIRQLIKNTENYPGLNSTAEKAAVFAWGNTTLFYGETEGYTMPLNAHTIYEFSFKTCGWSDGDMGHVNVDIKNASNEGLQTVSTKTASKRITESDPWDEFKIVFETGEAGNYKFGMWTSKHTTFTDLVLLKAVAEDITISENADYAPANAYANVTLDRTIKGGDTWNTFVVPFDISNDELKATFGNDVAVAEFSDAGESADAVTVSFNTMATPAITPNKPVLLKTSTEGTSYTFNGRTIAEGEAKVAGTYVDFVGTYDATTTVADGDYFISGNKLWKSSGSTTIKGTRAYIDAKNTSTVKLFIDGITTDIRSIDNGQMTMDNEAIYTIAGQRVQKAQKGLYIVNGKKVAVR